MVAPPTLVQVSPHDSDTTVGGLAVAMSAATIAISTAGRIRRARNSKSAPPSDRLLVRDCVAIGSANLFPALRRG
jgi:hypothetical protein